jgi:plastocyanin
MLAPALASAQSSGITAVDSPSPAWQGTPATVAVGEPLRFSYSGPKQHYVEFTSGPTPSCTPGVAMAYKTGSWSGECTFPAAGDYASICPVHDTPPYATMRGTVRVVTPTPTPEPSATPQPGASPTPAPPPADPTIAPLTSLKIAVASGQRGTRVRGRVEVPRAGSRLEVTLTARRVRIGRLVRTSLAPGSVSFSVPLNTKGRRTLRSRKRLEVTVKVALNELTRSQKVRLRG